jgi:hypothetical protein
MDQSLESLLKNRLVQVFAVGLALGLLSFAAVRYAESRDLTVDDLKDELDELRRKLDEAAKRIRRS